MVIGGGRPGGDGLWIEYVLLPKSLDEHLVAIFSGAVSGPSHAELINMFLEQAVANHKLSACKKDAETQSGCSASQTCGKTATVLCERAVKVAVSARYSLADIELVVSRNLQSLLLKALIKYDKSRFKLHECNLHRWVIHRALSSEPVRLRTSSTAAQISWSTADETCDVFDTSFPLVGITLTKSSEDEAPSLSFLEGILEKEKIVHKQAKRRCSENGEEVAGVANGGVRHDELNPELICEILFDVAESHFMRGRTRKAQEVFAQCSDFSAVCKTSPVDQDKLSGFITACRALTNSDAVLGSESGEAQVQETVLACERSRRSTKPAKVIDCPCNGSIEGDAASLKTKVERTPPVNGVKQANGCDIKGTKRKWVEAACENCVESKDISDIVVENVMRGNLSWSYSLALENDPSLPYRVRCQISASNILRRVLEGQSFRSFKLVIERFEGDKEGVEFLLRLMATVMRGNKKAGVCCVDGKAQRVQQFCIYVCCSIEKQWCWELAVQLGILNDDFVAKPQISDVHHQRGTGIGAADSSKSLLLDLLQADDVQMIEAVVSDLKSGEDVCTIIRQQAFDCLENLKDRKLAKRLYGLSKRINPYDIDSGMMLWYIDRTGAEENSLPHTDTRYNNNNNNNKCPGFGLLEYVIVRLLETEMWGLMVELTQWAHDSGFTQDEDIAFIVEEAAILIDLVPLCTVLDRKKDLTEDVAKVRPGLWQAFEDLVCLMVGSENSSSTTKSKISAKKLCPGIRVVPVISKMSNCTTLAALASLAAGRVQRFATDTSCYSSLELSRYGLLAQVTAASLPLGASKHRTVAAPKLSVDFGRRFLCILLERLVKLAAGNEEEKGGSQWLLGLADIAFEDAAYLKALQLYLKAGAVRSSYYCDRISSTSRDFLTPWVVTRMITACKEIGARIQAVVLCQCLPDPDYECAFQILQANPLIVDRDAALYFECVWEIPILELLVHMHAKSGDRERVNGLISLLQQPALNVHNPARIRKAHIVAMEQTFLHKLYDQLL